MAANCPLDLAVLLAMGTAQRRNVQPALRRLAAS